MQLRYVMTAALVAVVSIAGAGSAGAATKAEPTAQLVGKVKINKDGTGTVKARYICSGEGWHPRRGSLALSGLFGPRLHDPRFVGEYHGLDPVAQVELH